MTALVTGPATGSPRPTLNRRRWPVWWALPAVVALLTGLLSLALAGAALQSGGLPAGDGETDLFVTPGFAFRVVDALLTNFHLPRSTLLLLVSAFAGYGRVRRAYRAAVERQYRFFSFGDAMFVERA